MVPPATATVTMMKDMLKMTVKFVVRLKWKAQTGVSCFHCSVDRVEGALYIISRTVRVPSMNNYKLCINKEDY